MAKKKILILPFNKKRKTCLGQPQSSITNLFSANFRYHRKDFQRLNLWPWLDAKDKHGLQKITEELSVQEKCDLKR